MNRKPSFFRQAGILIGRYFHIFVNDKQNLLFTLLIPLLTILIVCAVACPDMYSVHPDEDYSINDGYPVLNWESVTQVGDSGTDEEDEEETTVSKWDGTTVQAPSGVNRVDSEDYFLITDASQLAFLSSAASNEETEEYLSYNYILQVDINLNSEEWTPIGTRKVPFTGTFNGNGHIIKNLSIDSQSDYVGLFGYVKSDEDKSVKSNISGNKITVYHNGIVENLQIKNADVYTTGKYAAVAVGYIGETARITSVSAKAGKVSADDGYVGAIAGCVSGSNVDIYVCYSTADVESKSDYTGGLVGNLSSSRLSGSYAASNVNYTGSGYLCGSIAGYCDNCSNQVENVLYCTNFSNETNLKAIENQDNLNHVYGVSSEELSNSSSVLTPFEDIRTAYEIKNDEYPDEQETIYGFKKDGQLNEFTGTQTGLFMLVCVAIFVGICNSIQEICKERNILKREYMTNLRLGSYVVSKLVVQAVVCAVQMVLVTAIFYLFVADKQLPTGGAIFGNIWIEYFITMFLLAFSADVMSLLVSSFVKNSTTANIFIPIILIVQIVFSGVLFEMNGVMDVLSYLMLSKWGISALAATSHLNDAQQSFLLDNQSLQLQFGSSMSTVSTQYDASPLNLLRIWLLIIAFTVLCAIACRFVLTNVRKDKR